jgi:hypothetical protein
MSETCLLIKTKDNRKFLTHEKNWVSLVEFAKTFKAEVYRVEPAAGVKPMELKALTAALCDAGYADDPEHAKVERLYPKAKRNRKEILTGAVKIRRFVRRRLLSGKALSLKELKEKYKGQGLTDACLCNHLSATRKELAGEGYVFRKIGAGKYCLTKSSGGSAASSTKKRTASCATAGT